MIELTQTILTLDAEYESALKRADAAMLERMKEADLNAERLIEKEQHRFETQKERDAALLEQELSLQRQEADSALDQRMKRYADSLDIDAMVEALFKVAKERVCP